MWLSAKAKVAVLAVGALFGLVACAAFGATVGKGVVVADQYSLVIPPAYSAEQVSDIEDFQVYRILDGSGKPILQIYFGNHPQTSLGM